MLEAQTPMTTGHSLNERDALVLQQLVNEYLESAQPVGSQTIAAAFKLRGYVISAATIRNILAGLEMAGWLEQPHVSAGRIPSRAGLQLYAHHLLQLQPLSTSQSDLFRHHYSQRDCDFQTILRTTSQLLSDVSQYASVVVTPRVERVLIKHIEFVQMGTRRILGILVAQNGMVFNRSWDGGDRLTISDLEKMSNYCNSVFFGLSIEDAVTKARREMEEARAAYDVMMTRALELSTQMLAVGEGGDVIMEAPWGLVDAHASIDQMRQSLQLIQEKRRLLTLMQIFKNAGKAQIQVGSDSSDDPWYNCGMVTAAYAEGPQILGCVGVMGPTRMDYSRVVPLVESAARYLGEWMRGA